MEKKGTDPISTIKAWLFPVVVTILSTVIWQDIKELKNDVKQLLAQSNIDKTRIDALQKQIDILNQTILHSNPSDPAKQANYLYGSKEFILTEQKKKKQVRYV